MGKLSDKDFVIDKHALDEEWERHVSLYMAYADEARKARLEMDECKNILEVVKAETAMAVRSNPDEYGLAKVTEQVVVEAVTVQEAVKDAQADLVQARYKHEMFQAAVNAMEHRKKQLESLVSLYLTGYFSEPKERHGEDSAVEEMRKQKLRRKKRIKEEQ